MDARIGHMERQEATGAYKTPPPPGARASGPPASTPPPGSQAQPRAVPQRPRPFSERLSENVQRARPLAVMGAFAHGDYAAGGRTIARAFLETMATDVRYARALGRGALGTAVTSAATAATAGAAGGAGGAAEGAMSAGAAGAAGAGEASLIGRVGAMLAGPVGMIATGLGIVAGAVVGVEAIRAQVAGQEYLLRGSVGGIGSRSDVGAFTGGVLDQGQRFLYRSSDTLKAAATLGTAGVGAGDMPNAVANSMAFARTSGIDLQRTTALTGQLMAKGGMSTAQVAVAFDDLQKTADKSGESVTKLVDSLESLLRATGGAAVETRGLAAVQGMMGTGTNVGQMMGPTMGATGIQATAAAAMLGISPEKLQGIQDKGDIAKMTDLVAATARKWAGGRRDQAMVNMLETTLGGAGLLDLAGISPKNRTAAIQTMLTASPTAAEDAAAAKDRRTALAREAEWQNRVARVAQDVVSWFGRLGLAMDYFKERVGMAGNDINGVARRLSPARVIGDNGAYVGPGGTPTAGNGTPLPGATANVYSTLPLMGYPTPSGTYNLPKGGTRIPNSRGGFDTMNPAMFREVVQAATRYKVPVALLMAELAKESDLNPTAERHNGPKDTSYGIAQFTPQALDLLRKRRGSPIFGMSAAQALAAAKNQHQAIPLAAYLNRQNYEQNGNDWQAGASAYNGSAAYGAAVMGSAGQLMQTLGSIPASSPPQQVKVHLTGSLDVRDEHGRPLGTATIKPQTATIDPARTPLGHRPVAPRPAIPHAPLHDHNRRA